MNGEYKYSIIIPTYNRAKALDHCLSHLVKQTFQNFEVIVCDDGSKDDSREMVQKYSDKLNITYSWEENWGGPARPRNIGIELANGEWICFLDSDDWYTPDRLELLLNELDNADFIYHDLTIIRDNETQGKITSRQLSKTNAYLDLLVNLNAIPTSSTCIKSKYLKEIGGFKEDKKLIGLEDFDLWVRLAKLNLRFSYINRTMGFYEFGGDNITFEDERQITRLNYFYKRFIASETNPKNIKKIQAALDYHKGYIYIKKGDTIKGISSLSQSILKGTARIKKKSAQALRFIVNGIERK